MNVLGTFLPAPCPISHTHTSNSHRGPARSGPLRLCFFLFFLFSKREPGKEFGTSWECCCCMCLLKETDLKEQERVIGGWGLKHGQWMKNIWVGYKIKYDAWKLLWAAQEGKCAGCKGEFAHPLERSMTLGLKPEVDHRHVIGRSCEAQDVRGLLCRRCNNFLGKIRDNATTLQNLVEYLRKHGDWYDQPKRG